MKTSNIHKACFHFPVTLVYLGNQIPFKHSNTNYRFSTNGPISHYNKFECLNFFDREPHNSYGKFDINIQVREWGEEGGGSWWLWKFKIIIRVNKTIISFWPAHQNLLLSKPYITRQLQNKKELSPAGQTGQWKAWKKIRHWIAIKETSHNARR